MAVQKSAGKNRNGLEIARGFIGKQKRQSDSAEAISVFVIQDSDLAWRKRTKEEEE